MGSLTRSRVAKLGIAGVVAAASIVVGPGTAANGSPPVGTGTTQLLARSTTVNDVNINYHGIHLRTKDEVDIVQLHFTGDPGWSSGWHEHTGPAIVTVKAGTLTIYQGSCEGTVVAAGKAYVERPGVAVVARNEGTVAADWYTTEIIPVAASTRDDVPEQCGLP